MVAGVKAHRAGRLQEAVGHYRKAAKAAPDFAPAHYNLGIALRALGQSKTAEQALRTAVKLNAGYARAQAALAALLESRGQAGQALKHWHGGVLAEPGNPETLAGLVGCLGSFRFNQINQPAEELIESLLRRKDVEGQRLAGTALSLLELRPKVHLALDGEGLGGLIADPPSLLLAVLERVIVAEPRWETLLTRMRPLLAQRFASLDAPEAPLVRALAAQMLATDYAFAVADDEDADPKPPPAIDTLAPSHAIYALYHPLQSVCERLRGPEAWAEFLALHLDRPREEQAAAKSIPTLTGIEDTVSRAVRDQYTALPYPRWKATRAIAAKPRRAVMAGMFPDKQVRLPEDPETLRVLVAGCGTGKHAVDVATRFADAEVLAVDLSRPSLGYAEAQAKRLGIANVRFAEADILALGGLSQRFDHIESVGVLHHLAEPLAGWRVLTGLLAPGGTMRIGLYSRRGRAAIKAAQRIARDFNHDAEGLRALRQAIRVLPADHPAAPVCRELDFYTLSGVRDALAHAQEHDYTLPEIGALVEALGVQFLGFEFATAQGHALYRKLYPDDGAMADLDRWDRLEQETPSLFHHMYQFWCRTIP